MRDKGYGVVANWNYVTISLVVFVVLASLVLYVPATRDFDSELLKIIRNFLAPYPQYIPAFFSNYGGVGNFWWPQITACAVLVSHQKFLKAFLLVFFTQGSYILVDFIKNFICRQRPCIHEGYSFPSGHATTTMCFYGIIIYLVLHYTRSEFWRYFLAVLFGLIIFFVSISRLWLGVHYPIDVITGLFLGFMMVNLYIITDKFFSKH